MDLAEAIYKETDAFPWTSEPSVGLFLRSLLVMTERRSALELGTFKGATTIRLTESLAEVMTVDLNDLRSPIFKENFGRPVFIQADSRTFDYYGRKFDFVYFDSVHERDHVAAEFAHVRPGMTKDCLLTFHDSELFAGVTQFVSEMETTGVLQTINLPTPRGCGLTLATLL